MRNIMHRRNIIVLFFVFVCANALAVDDPERQALSRLLHELAYLNTILVVAKNSSEAWRNTQFDYVALERDIQLIKTGITEYLNGERRAPRSLEAIQGDVTCGD